MEESPEADLQALQAFRKKASAELAKFKAEHSEIGRQTEQHDKMTLQLEEEANKMRKRMEGTQYYLLDKDLPVFRNTANAIAADRPDYSESLQTKFDYAKRYLKVAADMYAEILQIEKDFKGCIAAAKDARAKYEALMQGDKEMKLFWEWIDAEY